MDWLTLCILGVVWGFLLVPPPKKMTPTVTPGTDQPEGFLPPGRWILTPRDGSRLVGTSARARLRARGRRRKVYLFLIEAMALTGLIGLFPPLRGMLMVTGIIMVLLVAYTAAVLRFAATASAGPPRRRVVEIPELAEQDPALEEEQRRLVRLAR